MLSVVIRKGGESRVVGNICVVVSVVVVGDVGVGIVVGVLFC